MENTNQFIVCTQCFTYNQATFILEALHGFVAQQTEFPVVYTIVDDASTDDEPQILRDYFNENFCVDDSAVAYQEVADYGTVLYGQHKDNKNCYFAILLLNENHYSQRKNKTPYLSQWRDKAKYIALCEGDDYWTDALKLQKEVDILESDPSLVAVVTNTIIVDQDGNQIHPVKESVVAGNVEGRYNLRDYVHHHHSYPTASVLYRNIRNEDFERMREATRNPFYDDWNLWFVLHIFGDFYYLNEVTTAYRINPNSVTHKNTNERRLAVAKENFKINNTLKSVLPPEYEDLKKEFDEDAWIWYNLARAYWHSKKYPQSFYSLLRGFIKSPSQLFIELEKIIKRRK